MKRLQLPPIQRISVRGKRVLVRADLNVPVDRRGRVSDPFRIESFAPTLRWLVRNGARVIVTAHRGRPNGRRNSQLSLAPVAPVLAKLIKRPVAFSSETVGPTVAAAVSTLSNGDVLLLENLRFSNGEDRASLPFARQLAKLGDLFVFDGFGVAHRTTASTWTIKSFLPSYAGLLVQREVEQLASVTNHPKRPLAVIIGGAKISTKLQLVQALLHHVDALCLGGALANTLLAAQGIQIGRSMIEPGLVPKLKRLKLTNPRLHLPVDVWVSRSTVKPVGLRRVPVGAVGMDERIVDIGPDTVELITRVVRSARTVVWNGPLGIYEVPAFGKSTRQVARILAKLPAVTIAGGGETLDAIRSQRLGRRFTHRSTGGGAMLAFLEGRSMPGLELPKTPKSRVQ